MQQQHSREQAARRQTARRRSSDTARTHAVRHTAAHGFACAACTLHTAHKHNSTHTAIGPPPSTILLQFNQSIHRHPSTPVPHLRPISHLPIPHIPYPILLISHPCSPTLDRPAPTSPRIQLATPSPATQRHLPARPLSRPSPAPRQPSPAPRRARPRRPPARPCRGTERRDCQCAHDLDPRATPPPLSSLLAPRPLPPRPAWRLAPLSHSAARRRRAGDEHARARPASDPDAHPARKGSALGTHGTAARPPRPREDPPSQPWIPMVSRSSRWFETRRDGARQ